MSSTSKRSTPAQTSLCVSFGCQLASEVICRHCHEHYCYFCFLCHRKSLLDDMQSISEQMANNRRQGTAEVVAFINKQAKDAHDQAKKLIDDVIDRILKASQNINTYIENRRLAKLSRLEECLVKFDRDADMLNSKLTRQIFLPADQTLELRRKYTYNMFDASSVSAKAECDGRQQQNEKFFKDYRFFDELINLRQKWTFLQGALTTVYFPGKKDFSLDKIITFLEYRHDRVLENYREHLSTNDELQHETTSTKPLDELLNELSFLTKKDLLAPETCNFSYIKEDPIGTKSDSGHCDDDDEDDEDETASTSNHSWQLEDGESADDKRFEHDFQSLAIDPAHPDEEEC